jgi:threonine dehydrogenase-like Zn-dependent dehydrogenase
MPGKMQALVWEAPRVMALREQEVPRPQAGEVLVRVAYVGICGSELSGYLGHNALRVPPLVMGHEFSGEIVALGEEALEKNPKLALGQAVTANPLVHCGECDYCRQGANHLCTVRRVIGAHRPGALAGYVAVPAWMVVSLPAGLALRDGALVEPAACGVRAAQWCGNVSGETALVIGAGAIGLLTLQALLLAGAARVFIADTQPERLAAGAALGGEPLDPRAVKLPQVVREATGGLGAFAAVDAVGKAITREQCVSAVRSLGTVVLEENSVLPTADIIRREITLHGSFAYSPRDFSAAADLLQAGRLRLAPWMVEAPLAEGGSWFERLSGENPGGTAKVLLKP